MSQGSNAKRAAGQTSALVDKKPSLTAPGMTTTGPSGTSHLQTKPGDTLARGSTSHYSTTPVTYSTPGQPPIYHQQPYSTTSAPTSYPTSTKYPPTSTYTTSTSSTYSTPTTYTTTQPGPRATTGAKYSSTSTPYSTATTATTASSGVPVTSYGSTAYPYSTPTTSQLSGGTYSTLAHSKSTGNSSFRSASLHEQQRQRDTMLRQSYKATQQATLEGASVAPYYQTPPQTQTCFACNAVQPQYLCSKCCRAWYCSRPCQLTDWPKHKTGCHPLQVPTSATQTSRGYGPITSTTASTTTSTTTSGTTSTQRVTRPCFVCKKEATCKCSICGSQFYCGRECQIAAWATHKQHCKAASSTSAYGSRQGTTSNRSYYTTSTSKSSK
eukprot:m.86826 g.86826  ORF g.86826 m.86826 type:complete len:382 (+) comp12816_c0_seq1:355-1500(+)